MGCTVHGGWWLFQILGEVANHAERAETWVGQAAAVRKPREDGCAQMDIPGVDSF